MTNELLHKIEIRIGGYAHPADEKEIARMIDLIAELKLDRTAYLSLLGTWKDRYRQLTEGSRTAKRERRDGDEHSRGLAQSRVSALRYKARALLTIRQAMKRWSSVARRVKAEAA